MSSFCLLELIRPWADLSLPSSPLEDVACQVDKMIFSLSFLSLSSWFTENQKQFEYFSFFKPYLCLSPLSIK